MFLIRGRKIGPGQPVYVIAEMSCNHHGRYDEAEALVRAAKDAGADAIKLQTYTPDTLTLDSELPHFTIKDTIWKGRKLYDLYREAMTPWEWHPRLKTLAESLGLHFFTSPFDATAVDYLETLDVPAYKIASFECVDIPLLRRVAKTGKPVIMSTGMATLEEIREALETLRAGGASVALLKCASAYPAIPESMNLRAIGTLAREFEVPVGLSDHTLGAQSSIAAVALGACIVEKHLILSRSSGGPDSAFSTEPHELEDLVKALRATEKALGTGIPGPAPHELPSRAFRRSIFVVKDVGEGEAFTLENVRSIRPADGLHTRHLDEVLGRRAAKAIPRGTPLAWDLIA